MEDYARKNPEENLIGWFARRCSLREEFLGANDKVIHTTDHRVRLDVDDDDGKMVPDMTPESEWDAITVSTSWLAWMFEYLEGDTTGRPPAVPGKGLMRTRMALVIAMSALDEEKNRPSSKYSASEWTEAAGILQKILFKHAISRDGQLEVKQESLTECIDEWVLGIND